MSQADDRENRDNHSRDEIKLFQTEPHPCSYLDEQQATTLFIDPEADVDTPLYTTLSHNGFRRSGHYFYRPNCSECEACIPLRIPVAEFEATRSQRRLRKRNQQFTVAAVDSLQDDNIYALYEKYINARHSDGDMYPPSRQQYDSFLCQFKPDGTHYVAVYDGDKLIAIAVTDELHNALSAIYTFYDPDYERYSLGSYCILMQLELCQRLSLPYLYLGYWIKACEKMRYKTRFRPFELRIKGQWLRLN